MSQKTLTRIDLAKSLNREVGLSHNECSELVEDVLDKIAYSLDEDGKVAISNFGTFAVRQKKERMGRNPKTNEEVPISARKVVMFKASQKLKERVATRSK